MGCRGREGRRRLCSASCEHNIKGGGGKEEEGGEEVHPKENTNRASRRSSARLPPCFCVRCTRYIRKGARGGCGRRERDGKRGRKEGAHIASLLACSIHTYTVHTYRTVVGTCRHQARPCERERERERERCSYTATTFNVWRGFDYAQIDEDYQFFPPFLSRSLPPPPHITKTIIAPSLILFSSACIKEWRKREREEKGGGEKKENKKRALAAFCSQPPPLLPPWL